MLSIKFTRENVKKIIFFSVYDKLDATIKVQKAGCNGSVVQRRKTLVEHLQCSKFGATCCA
jgi:hypothetical protein